MPPGKVLRYVDVHEEQGDLPAVERQPVHLRPGHLLTVDNRQAQGEGVVVGDVAADASVVDLKKRFMYVLQFQTLRPNIT